VAGSGALPQTEKEAADTMNDAVLIEDIEEDWADVSEMIDAPTEPDKKP
jgi:hypothetical protein